MGWTTAAVVTAAAVALLALPPALAFPRATRATRARFPRRLSLQWGAATVSGAPLLLIGLPIAIVLLRAHVLDENICIHPYYDDTRRGSCETLVIHSHVG